ncbi:Uncharacterised protein [Escherichia coli]|nr:Uncharacterised protein [Escherichia coli]
MAEAFKEQVVFRHRVFQPRLVHHAAGKRTKNDDHRRDGNKDPSGAAECGDPGQGVGNRRFRIGEFVEGHQAGNHQRQQGVEHQNQQTGTNQRSWHGFSGVFNFAGHITDRGHAGIRPTGGRDPRQQRHKAARCANRSGGRGGKILRFKPEDPKANDDSERDNFGDGN